MGQVLHGSARTTEAVRRAIQRSEESVRALARRHGISPTTVQKWRKRSSVADAPMGPKAIHSTVLTLDEEAMIVAFRRHTLLPLDDCLYALQPTIPHLTRSALHRCLQRHGISRLPDMAGDKPENRKFKPYPIGYFHIDITEVRTEEGKLHLFVAIDRTSKFAFAQLHEKADRPTAVSFLELCSRQFLTGSTRSSLTMASSSPICRRTVTDGPRDTASTASTRSAASMASSTGSPSRTIHGPMARSSE